MCLCANCRAGSLYDVRRSVCVCVCFDSIDTHLLVNETGLERTKEQKSNSRNNNEKKNVKNIYKLEFEFNERPRIVSNEHRLLFLCSYAYLGARARTNACGMWPYLIFISDLFPLNSYRLFNKFNYYVTMHANAMNCQTIYYYYY